MISQVKLSSQELTPTGTLPVFYINVKDHQPITSKEDYLDATFSLDSNGYRDYPSLSTEQDGISIQIKGRGNFTWYDFEKKPYKIKLSKKVEVLGLPKNKHFALLAHADDIFGFLRNPVGFKVSELLGMEWTPHFRPCELVLNGEYVGLYFLTETIRVDKNRVHITEQPDLTSDLDSITGGWLVEIDNYIEENQISPNISGTSLQSFRVTYHSPENLSDRQKDYLQSQFELILSTVFQEDKNLTAWEKYVDIESLVKFYLVAEMTYDVEAFLGSCYLHKDIGENEKWKFGPVWDLGGSFFNEGGAYLWEQNVWPSAGIIEELSKYPRFIDLVKMTWNEFYKTKFIELIYYIDEFVDEIESASVKDAQRWPQNVKWQNLDSVRVIAGVVKDRLIKKAEWLDKVYGDEASAIGVVTEQGNKDYYNLMGRKLLNSNKSGLLIIRDHKGRTQKRIYK